MACDICHIYFIRSDAGRDVVKVGLSSNPRKRLQSLKASSPYRLSLFASVEFSSRVQADWAERTMHCALSKYRMSGEWFSVSAASAFSLYQDIVELIAGQDFHPDDFVEICQMTAFQRLGDPP